MARHASLFIKVSVPSCEWFELLSCGEIRSRPTRLFLTLQAAGTLCVKSAPRSLCELIGSESPQLRLRACALRLRAPPKQGGGGSRSIYVTTAVIASVTSRAAGHQWTCKDQTHHVSQTERNYRSQKRVSSVADCLHCAEGYLVSGSFVLKCCLFFPSWTFPFYSNHDLKNDQLIKWLLAIITRTRKNVSQRGCFVEF